MEIDLSELANERYGRTLAYIIRAAIALNFVRFALSFSSSFEGSATGGGLADRIFASHRLGGFRIDAVWLFASTCVIFFAALYFLLNVKSDPTAKTDVYLCIAWVVAFVIFVARSFLTGTIDFG